MTLTSSLVFIVIPVVLILMGLWLLKSSTHQGKKPPRQPKHTNQHRSALTLSEDDSDAVLGLKQMDFSEQQKSIQKKTESINSSISRKVPSIISLYLVATPEHPFMGYELLQSLLSAGLRYGDMQIFHRHETKTGQGSVLFSLASAISPGTFEFAKMGTFSSTALCLVLNVKKVADPLNTYDLMLETAQQLQQDLGGTILDDHRQRLNKEIIHAKREQLKSMTAVV